MNKKSIYVAPFISATSNGKLKEFFEADKNTSSIFFDKTIQWQDLLLEQRTFVLGEPGYGKSRIFQELYKVFIQEGKQCCWVELKAVKGELLATIQEYLATEHIKRRSIHATSGFQLENTDEHVLFLDALDEVYIGHIPALIEEINHLSHQYPKLKIFISCRTHHILRYEAELYSLNFNCVKIRAFTPWQTVDFLQVNCEALRDINQEVLLRQLEETNIYSFPAFSRQPQPTLMTPRYLEIVAELITDSSLENILRLRRHELFERMIVERIKKEAKKNRGGTEQRGLLNKIYLIKQYLERLALIMEMQRVNVITKDDFVTFNLDTQMNINQQIMQEVLLDGTILKDNIDTLEFDNTEFQEYLAAKAISRLGRTEQIVFDLAVQQQLKSIYPSWVNVMGYLIELHPEILLPLVEFGERVEQAHIFDLIKYYRVELHQDAADSVKIFSKIFLYYAERSEYLPYKFEEQLYKFYSHSNHYETLKQTYDLERKNDNPKNNTIRLLRLFFKEEALPVEEVDYWKAILLATTTNPNSSEYLLEEAIRTLAIISQIKELAPFEASAERFGKLFRNTLMKAYIDINPNHPKSIEGILNMISRNEIGVHIDAIDSINTKKGFVVFFTQALNDKIVNIEGQTYLGAINKNISFYSKKMPLFFENLAKLWDKEIEKLVIQFLLNSVKKYDNRNSSFFNYLSKSFIALNPKAPFSILEQLQPMVKDEDIKVGITDYLGLIIQPEQFDSFYKKAIDLGFSKKFFLLILSWGNKELRALKKSYYPKELDNSSKYQRENRLKQLTREMKQEARQLELYEKFVTCLDKEHFRILEDYSYYKEVYEKRLTDFQRKELVKLALKYIQENNPREGRTKVEDKTTTTYGVPVLMSIAVSIVYEAGEDLSAYRSKLLGLLPFTWYPEIIFKVVQNITQTEFEELLKWFNAPRTDSLQTSGVGNIIELIEKNHIKVASDFLIQVVNNEMVSRFYRNRSLQILHSWNEQTISFYESVFNHAVSQPKLNPDTNKWSDNYYVALGANDILIQKEEETAIEWRMNEIRNARYKVRRNFSGGRGVGEEESLFVPFKHVKNIRFKERMLTFFEQSFEALAEHEDYYEYVRTQYWDVIVHYFCQLKIYKKQLHQFLEELRVIVQRNSHIRDVFSFNGRLRKIEDEYLAYLSQPEKFAYCIQQFNHLKSKKHIDIAYNQELFKLIIDVINTELRDWVHQGYYGFIQDLESTRGGAVGREQLIQKSLVTQLENFLLKRGLRASDMQEVSWQFYREVEKLDGEKTDIIITYGAIGSVMIEVKRAGNSELSKKERIPYRDNKFIPYLKQTNCDYGIFLIFRTEPKAPVGFQKQIKEVKEVYKNLQNVVVIGMDCPKKASK